MAKKNEVLPVAQIDLDKIPVEEHKKSEYKEMPSEEVVESVIDELEALLVQRTKEAREYTMRVFWETGKLLREAEKEHKVNISRLVARVVADNRIAGRQMGERNIWFAIKVFDRYPRFEDLYDTEHGENISISKVKKMLVTPRPKKKKTLQQIAYDLIDMLGVDGAEELIEEIKEEIKRRHSTRDK